MGGCVAGMVADVGQLGLGPVVEAGLGAEAQWFDRPGPKLSSCLALPGYIYLAQIESCLALWYLMLTW